MLTPHNLLPMSDIRSKLAKLLRLSSSSNVHEAANAARMLDRLCAENGLDPANVESDADDQSLTAIYFQFGEVFSRRDYAQCILMMAVCRYYNGDLVVTKCGHRQRFYKIFCTEGNKVRIEVYYEYLAEVMDKLADQAKADNPGSTRSFRLDFRKGFAEELARRLRELKQEAVVSGPGLVRVNREKQAVADLMKKSCGRIRYTSTRAGYGASHGRDAAQGVGLSEQVRGQGRLALPTR